MDGAVFTLHGRSDATATSTTPYDSGSAVELRQRPRRPTMSTATFAVIVRNRSAERRSVRMASVLPRTYQRTPQWSLDVPLELEAGASATVRLPIGRATCVNIESSVLPAAAPRDLAAAAESSERESESPAKRDSPNAPLSAGAARIDDGAGEAEDVVEAMIAGRLRCVAVGPRSVVSIDGGGAIACAGAGSARPAREESALALLRKLATSAPQLAALLQRANQPIEEIAAAALAATAPLHPAATEERNAILIAFYALVLRQVPMHRPLSAGRVNVDTVCFEVDPVPFLAAFATAFYAAAAAASTPSTLRLPRFVDQAFPAAATSVASRYDASEKANRKYAMIAAGSVWRRPGEMRWAKQYEELDPRLEGVVQGERAGNCWLCSMLASLAESVPGIVRESVAPWPSRAHAGGSGEARRDVAEGSGGGALSATMLGAFSVRLWIDGASCSGLAAPFSPPHRRPRWRRRFHTGALTDPSSFTDFFCLLILLLTSSVSFSSASSASRLAALHPRRRPFPSGGAEQVFREAASAESEHAAQRCPRARLSTRRPLGDASGESLCEVGRLLAELARRDAERADTDRHSARGAFS